MKRKLTASATKCFNEDIPHARTLSLRSRLIEMDLDERSPKRRRTSSADSSQSSERGPRHSRPLRRQGSSPQEDRQYDHSSQDASRDGSRAKPRSQSEESDSYTPASAATRSPSPIEPNRSPALNFTLLHTIPKAHARGITCLKFSPDGRLLATSSADATIHIYFVPSNFSNPPTTSQPNPGFTHLKTLHGHLAGVNALSWSPRGPPYTLASASDDKSILLWQPLTSDLPIPPSPLTGHSNYVYSLAFSPKGNMLASGSHDEAVFLWDVRAGRVMRSLPAHSDPVGGVDFLPVDGSMVVSCAGDGLIRIWDAGTGQCLRTLVDEDRRPVTCVRFSPNGRFVLAWTLDGCVRLWKYIEGRGSCVKTYQGHRNREYGLQGCVGDYGARRVRGKDLEEEEQAFVVSGSEDGDIVAWDVGTKDVLWRGRGHRAPVIGVDFVRVSKDREGGRGRGRGLLVSGGLDRDVKIWIEDVGSEDAEVDGDREDGKGQRRGRVQARDERSDQNQGDDDDDVEMDDGFQREDTEEEMRNQQLMDGIVAAAAEHDSDRDEVET